MATRYNKITELRSKVMQDLVDQRRALADQRKKLLDVASRQHGLARRKTRRAIVRAAELEATVIHQMEHTMEEEHIEIQTEAMNRMTREQTEMFRATVAQMRERAAVTQMHEDVPGPFSSVSSTASAPPGGGTDEVTHMPGEAVAGRLSFEEQAQRAAGRLSFQKRARHDAAKYFEPSEPTTVVCQNEEEKLDEQIELTFAQALALRLGEDHLNMHPSFDSRHRSRTDVMLGRLIPAAAALAGFVCPLRGNGEATLWYLPFVLGFGMSMIFGGVTVGLVELWRRRNKRIVVKPGPKRVFFEVQNEIHSYKDVMHSEFPKRDMRWLLDRIDQAIEHEKRKDERRAEKENEELLRKTAGSRSMLDDMAVQMETERARASMNRHRDDALEQLEEEIRAEMEALDGSMQRVKEKANEKQDGDTKKNAAACAASKERA